MSEIPLILNEDNALKNAVMGMVVHDEKNAARPVKVYFGQPDNEIREQLYPYATIDLVDITYDADRASSGLIVLPYIPDGAPAPAAGTSYWMEVPLPLSLYYSVTCYSRHPRHDREIKAQMLHKFPYKFGGIYVPEDDTIRPAWQVQYRPQDGTEGGKRLFRSIYTIRVFSEMLPSVAAIAGQVNQIVLTLPDIAVNYSVSQP